MASSASPLVPFPDTILNKIGYRPCCNVSPISLGALGVANALLRLAGTHGIVDTLGYSRFFLLHIFLNTFELSILFPTVIFPEEFVTKHRPSLANLGIREHVNTFLFLACQQRLVLFLSQMIFLVGFLGSLAYCGSDVLFPLKYHPELRILQERVLSPPRSSTHHIHCKTHL